MGLLRLFLALSVVAAHAGGEIVGLPQTAPDLAVNVFFIISGFYMALILNGAYRKVSLRTFYVNRALRIYPVYWIALALGTLVEWGSVTQTFRSLNFGEQVYFVLSNSLLVGQDVPYTLCLPAAAGCVDHVAFTIVPPSWSLSVELGFYAIAPFILRNPRLTYAYVLTGALYLMICRLITVPSTIEGLASNLVDSYSYFVYGASFMFFGLGALAYQLRSGLTRFRGVPAVLLVVLMSLTSTTMQFWMPLLIALAVPALFELTKHSRVDRIVGDLSYPVYVLHWPALAAMRSLFPANGWALRPDHLPTIVAAACIVLGLAINGTLERAVRRFRHSLLLTRQRDPVRRTRAAGPARLRLLTSASTSWVRRAAFSMYFVAPFALVIYAIARQRSES